MKSAGVYVYSVSSLASRIILFERLSLLYIVRNTEAPRPGSIMSESLNMATSLAHSARLKVTRVKALRTNGPYFAGQYLRVHRSPGNVVMVGFVVVVVVTTCVRNAALGEDTDSVEFIHSLSLLVAFCVTLSCVWGFDGKEEKDMVLLLLLRRGVTVRDALEGTAVVAGSLVVMAVMIVLVLLSTSDVGAGGAVVSVVRYGMLVGGTAVTVLGTRDASVIVAVSELCCSSLVCRPALFKVDRDVDFFGVSFCRPA